MSLHAADRRALRENDSHSGSLRGPAVRILLDFDGTITLLDTVDRILEQFASPQWRDIERAWQAGYIGSRECLQKQTALLSATPAALDALIDAIPIDPGLATLVRRCRDIGADLLIVSDGYDRVIRRVLERANLAVPFVANVLRPAGRDQWTLSSPAFKSDCRVGAGHCKCARVPSAAPVVLIGDGRSDFCVAHAAQFVIAKGRLASYCAQQHLRSVAVVDLSEAADALNAWMTQHEHGKAPRLERGATA